MRADRSVRASWRQTTIHPLIEARPVEKGTTARGERVLAYRVRLADGSTVKLDADVVCERLSNEHGERIVLTTDRAAHILAAHMRGRLGGVFLPGMTLTQSLTLFRRHWHEPLGSGRRTRKIVVPCHRIIGTSSVASARELAERGVLSDADLRRLAQLKEEVFSTNLQGSAHDQAALVERVNRRWRTSNVRLTARTGVVLPAFIAPPPPTQSFVVVLDRNGESSQMPSHQMQIRTFYPGKLLCDPPAAGQRERDLLHGYRDAFEVWYEHGRLLPMTLRPRR